MEITRDNLVRIDPSYLVSTGKIIDFDIYTSRSRDREPILLFPENSAVAELKQFLRKKKTGPLFVHKDVYHRFEKLMEDSMEELIIDASIPLDKKSEIIYGCARNILKDVFDDPRSGKNLTRTKKITGNLVRYALNNLTSIPSLLKLGSHDYYTFSHCVNVAVFAIGLKIKISGSGDEEELTAFALGCILHDIGKTEIPDGVLNKPGKLTEAEFELIKEHPVHGTKLMEGSAPDTALDVIRHHHEKANGKGYPDKLKGEEISENAKIATIADVYDALTTNRPYSGAYLPFSALHTMKDEMVGHFAQDKFVEFIRFLGGIPSKVQRV